MGGGRIFQKPSAPLSLMTTYRMRLLSSWSISLDTTFQERAAWFRNYLRDNFRWKNIAAEKAQNFNLFNKAAF